MYIHLSQLNYIVDYTLIAFLFRPSRMSLTRHYNVMCTHTHLECVSMGSACLWGVWRVYEECVSMRSACLWGVCVYGECVSMRSVCLYMGSACLWGVRVYDGVPTNEAVGGGCQVVASGDLKSEHALSIDLLLRCPHDEADELTVGY